MQADEAAHESVQHVQRAILHVLTHTVVALLLEPPDHVGGEEPQTEVDPSHNHKSVEAQSDGNREDVDRQLEQGNCKVGHIVQNHDCRPDRKHVQRIRKEDESPSHHVVKHVLREVGS